MRLSSIRSQVRIYQNWRMVLHIVLKLTESTFVQITERIQSKNAVELSISNIPFQDCVLPRYGARAVTGGTPFL